MIVGVTSLGYVTASTLTTHKCGLSEVVGDNVTGPPVKHTADSVTSRISPDMQRCKTGEAAFVRKWSRQKKPPSLCAGSRSFAPMYSVLVCACFMIATFSYLVFSTQAAYALALLLPVYLAQSVKHFTSSRPGHDLCRRVAPSCPIGRACACLGLGSCAVSSKNVPRMGQRPGKRE